MFGGESQVGEEDDTGTTDAIMSGGDSHVHIGRWTIWYKLALYRAWRQIPGSKEEDIDTHALWRVL